MIDTKNIQLILCIFQIKNRLTVVRERKKRTKPIWFWYFASEYIIGDSLDTE